MNNFSGNASHDGNNAAVHVLLAEDEFLIRYDIAEIIRDLGWHVYEASSADEGIAMIERGTHIDLLISDINMPGETDGSDLASAVRSTLPDARIVLMSGMVRARALPEKACDLFIPKPVVDLQNSLLTLMANRVRMR